MSRVAAMTPGDLPWVLEINRAFETELSPLTMPRLEELVQTAFAARVAGGGAFLLAFDQNADYDSPNFLWFRERARRFVYVDRIAVAATHRRRGLAAALYADLFAQALAAGHARVCCEVNSDPPNPGSDAFHKDLGFEVVGEARLPERGKSVRYLMRRLVT